MPFDREPRVPIDPVSGFFAGFTSFFARMFLGVIAIGCGLAAGAHWSGGWGFLAIFGWAERGVWFLLGISTFVAIFVGLWAYIQGADGRRAFFFLFSVAALHFAPGLFPPDTASDLLWAVGIYGIAALCYWVLPPMIATVMHRNVEDEIETVPPIEEPYPGESQSEPGAVPFETANEEPPVTGAEPLDHPADEEQT